MSEVDFKRGCLAESHSFDANDSVAENVFEKGHRLAYAYDVFSMAH